MTAKHIETGRIMLRKFMKKKGKIWIKVFPWAAITKKPVGARMGKGKGKHFKWIVPLKKGTIIYEIAGISQSKAYLALLKCGLRMPFRFKIVKLKY
jgi:large subunit ribosomal protein L16